MLKPGDIAIVSGARTPLGRYCGKLRDFTAQELGAVAAKEAIHRAGVDPKEFDHAVFGNAQQTSGDAIYGARHVGFAPGFRLRRQRLTVNRLCGSGMQSIVNAAAADPVGRSQCGSCRRHGSYVAGAVHYSRRALGLAWAGKLEDSLMVALFDSFCGLVHGEYGRDSMPSNRESRAMSRTNSRCARRSAPTMRTKPDASRKNSHRSR